VWSGARSAQHEGDSLCQLTGLHRLGNERAARVPLEKLSWMVSAGKDEGNFLFCQQIRYGVVIYSVNQANVDYRQVGSASMSVTSSSTIRADERRSSSGSLLMGT
jgi:hypothetical protein